MRHCIIVPFLTKKILLKVTPYHIFVLQLAIVGTAILAAFTRAIVGITPRVDTH